MVQGTPRGYAHLIWTTRPSAPTASAHHQPSTARERQMSQHDQNHSHIGRRDDRDPTTAVTEVSGAHWATNKSITEAVLGRRPRCRPVAHNPLHQHTNRHQPPGNP